MRLLLAGGGTGGHLFPAVALAQKFLDEEYSAQVLFVGTKAGIEAKVLPELGLPLETIEISGIAGRSWLGRLRILPALVGSVRQSLAILDRFRPDVVVGVGGYASGPTLLAARIKGIPFLIHEQNAQFGMTNRFLARWAERICISIPPGRKTLPYQEHTVLTGNPVRRGIADCPPLPERNPTLLIFGGSRGARAINDAVLAALSELHRSCPQLRIIHQTGSDDYERVRAAYAQAGLNSTDVVPFINDMAAAYTEAHLVLCRAGATTLAELTAAGRPSILIPYPHAAADHQTANARVLADQGAALLLPQSELTATALGTLLCGLITDRATLLRMATIAHSLGQPQAVDKLLHECRAIARRG